MGKYFLQIFITALLFSKSLVAQVSGKQPNIVLIFADDLGYKDTRFTGSDFYETPNIDRLAKEGMFFSNAYSSAANCAPSRGTLISGQYNSRHGIFAVGTTMKGPSNMMRLAPVPNTQHLASSTLTIAETLKNAGYATGQFGKWHIGSEDDQTDPGSQGFDVYMDPPSSEWSGKPGIKQDPKATFQITNAALKFISDNKDKPFFTFISHHAVHGPHQAREASLNKFKAKKPGKNHSNALYAACIYDLDESVGLVMNHLKKLGLDKNTLVIFTSDNGGTPTTPQEPLRGNKGSFYEGGIRVPFIARWTGTIKAGSTSATPISNVDLFPTFREAASSKLPSGKILDGESLMPILTSKKSGTTRDKLFWHFPGYLAGTVIRGRNEEWRTQPVTVMRKGDYKIFLYHEEWVLEGGWDKRSAHKGVELYNLKEDIGERQNIASSNPAKRDEMLNDLLSWMKTIKAPMATIKTPAQEQRMMRAEGKKKNKNNKEDDE